MDLDRLADVIETTRASSGIPGIAIGVVAGGEVIASLASGVRSLESGQPMSTRTRYPIASTTKAMNATLLGMLVDEGVLDWDRPVQEDLPDFGLADAAAGRTITLRDLVTMRTGLPRHEWMWDSGTLKRRDDLAHRFRHLEVLAPPRERFLYNNFTVTLSGHIAERVTGIPWERLVTDRLLRPLGMSETITAVPEAGETIQGYGHSASGALMPNIPLDGAVTAPSGGIIRSHITDMTNWLLFNLAGGAVEGRRLVSAATFAELRSPQIRTEDGRQGFSPTAAYAHGWFVDDVAGERRVSHGGYLDDVDSSVMMFPDRGVGVVCVSNAGPFGVARPIAQTALELAIGVEPTVSLEMHLGQYRTQRQARLDLLASTAPDSADSPSRRLGAFAGVYRHPAYGRMSVDARRDGLSLGMDSMTIALEHWGGDAWVGAQADVDRLGLEHPFDRTNPVRFETDARGEPALLIRFEPLCAPIRFDRLG